MHGSSSWQRILVECVPFCLILKVARRALNEQNSENVSRLCFTLWFQYREENRMIFKYLQYLILITKGEANICFMSLQYSWIWKLYDVCRIHQIIKSEVSGERILTNEERNAFLMWINLINVVEESYIHQPLLHEAVSYHKI